MKRSHPRNARSLLRKFALGAIAGTLAICCAHPAAATVEHFDYFDGVYLGAGFFPDRAQVYSSPLTLASRRSAQRVTTGAPLSNDTLITTDELKHSESGASFDLRLEGRYIGWKGSASASFSEALSRTQRDFYLGYRLSRDFGEYQLFPEDLVLTPEADALRRKGYWAFRKQYGSHCVFAERRHSYLTATYSVKQLSDEQARRMGATWSIGGGGYRFSGSIIEQLQKASKVSSVSVRIKGLGNINMGNIIRNADQVVVVQNEFQSMGALLDEKDGNGNHVIQPVAYRYSMIPWDELLTFPNASGDMYFNRVNDYFFEREVEHWVQARRIEARILDAIKDSAFGYYSYLSPENITALTNIMEYARLRADEIEIRLAKWIKRTDERNEFFYFPDIITIDESMLRPEVQLLQHTLVDGNAHYYFTQFRLIGGNRFFTCRARNLVDGAYFTLENNAPGGGNPNWNRSLQVETSNSMLGQLCIRRGFSAEHIQEWLFEVLNRNGEVVATKVLPRVDGL